MDDGEKGSVTTCVNDDPVVDDGYQLLDGPDTSIYDAETIPAEDEEVFNFLHHTFQDIWHLFRLHRRLQYFTFCYIYIYFLRSPPNIPVCPGHCGR